jgi:hypothetical protein
MDDQDTVVARHPEAVEEPLVLRQGDDSPVQRSHWEIHTSPDWDAVTLGSGSTEERAWTDAVRKMGHVHRGAG